MFLQAVRKENGVRQKGAIGNCAHLSIGQSKSGEAVDVTNEIDEVMGALNSIEINDAIYDDYEFIDDISAKPLEKNKAIEARRLEIEFFRRKQVYEKVPRSQAAGRNVISTRWLDVNKGDQQRLNYRARLVGRELKLKDKRLDLFAATPPLETLRLLCSMCASNQRMSRPYRLLSIDVKPSCLYAPACRELYIYIYRYTNGGLGARG